MSSYVEAKHAEAQRRRADLLAQVELAKRAGCKSMAEMAEFLNRSGFRNADGGPWNAHSFQTSLAKLRASTPDTAEERPGADAAGPLTTRRRRRPGQPNPAPVPAKPCPAAVTRKATSAALATTWSPW